MLSTLPVRMEIGIVTMENIMFPQNINSKTDMIPQFHIYVYIQRYLNQDFKEIFWNLDFNSIIRSRKHIESTGISIDWKIKKEKT
jgi:hypothetical protein